MYKPYCLNFRLKSELEKEPIKILLMFTLDADADMRSSFFQYFLFMHRDCNFNIEQR